MVEHHFCTLVPFNVLVESELLQIKILKHNNMCLKRRFMMAFTECKTQAGLVWFQRKDRNNVHMHIKL